MKSPAQHEAPQPEMYVKKPIPVRASQWFKNGDHPEDWTNLNEREKQWEGKVVRYFRRPDVPGPKACKECNKTMHVHGWIDTKEGGHIVCPGDWIITGIAGEHYPCKPDIFAQTYEPLSISGNEWKTQLIEIIECVREEDRECEVSLDVIDYIRELRKRAF